MRVFLAIERGHRTSEYIASHLTCSCQGALDGGVIEGTAHVGRLADRDHPWKLVHVGKAPRYTPPPKSAQGEIASTEFVPDETGGSLLYTFLMMGFGGVFLAYFIIKKMMA